MPCHWHAIGTPFALFDKIDPEVVKDFRKVSHPTPLISPPLLPSHPVFQSNLAPVETQHYAILLHVTPPCPPHHSLTSNASNLAPLDCSAPDILVGGHAVAITSPRAIFLRPCGSLDLTFVKEGAGDSRRTPSASELTASLHPDHDNVDERNCGAD